MILQGPTNINLFGTLTRLPMTYSRKVEGNPNIETVEDPKFTGAVYLYYEGHLEDEQRSELRKLFADQGAKLWFRGKEFMKPEGPK